jgi:hypothetical protein
MNVTQISTGTPNANTALEDTRREFEAQVTEIMKTIKDPELARAIVTSARANPLVLQRFFYVQQVTYKWGAGSGIDVSFEFQNYIEARFDVAGVGGKQDPSNADEPDVEDVNIATSGGGIDSNAAAAPVFKYTVKVPTGVPVNPLS